MRKLRGWNWELPQFREIILIEKVSKFLLLTLLLSGATGWFFINNNVWGWHPCKMQKLVWVGMDVFHSSTRSIEECLCQEQNRSNKQKNIVLLPVLWQRWDWSKQDTYHSLNFKHLKMFLFCYLPVLSWLGLVVASKLISNDSFIFA